MQRSSKKVRGFVASHKAGTAATGIVLAAVAIFVAVWFQPQKLFLNTRVSEPAPAASNVATASPSETALAGPPAAAPTAPVTLRSGTFRRLEHATTGTAKLIRLADGSAVLRLERLSTSNGPDVRVYLSKLPADRGQNAYGRDFIDLGALKGNRGDQNYAIPAGTDLDAFQSAVIWCRRFTVGFGVAPLARPA